MKTDNDYEALEKPCHLCGRGEAKAFLQGLRREMRFCAACALHRLPEAILEAVFAGDDREEQLERANEVLDRLADHLREGIGPNDSYFSDPYAAYGPPPRRRRRR
jgi:hypothetical protein